MMHLVSTKCIIYIYMCVCVCLHNNLKTSPILCFLLRSKVNWRKISDVFTCQGHLSEVFKVTWYAYELFCCM